MVAGSSVEDGRAKEEGKEKLCSGNIFRKKYDTNAERTHCHREFKTEYANTTGLLRHLKHTRPNISTCTRKESESM